MKNKAILSAVFVIMVFFSGCQKPQRAKQYDRPLPPGELALRKITNPDEVPDFTEGCYGLADMQKAIDNSLNYLSKPSSKRFFPYGDITHQRVTDSLKAFKKLVTSGLRGREFSESIREQFDVYVSVGCDDKGTVLFTGYYTPIFEGSPVATERFRYPLYGPPDNLAKGPNGEILGRRGADGQMTPCPPRADIENSGILKGKELVWLADPFEAYIAHVQGSAKIKMPNGQLVTIGYAANNGYEYHGIAEKLISDGRIPADKMSLSAMIDYFKANVNQVLEYTKLNPRFVFFQKSEGPARGSLNEPVTPMRTIATDKSVYPRACLAFISTVMPRMTGNNIFQNPYEGFALDQDTGGAIRAAGRCDVYIGQGETAGKLAGQTYQEGRLYYLFLKPAYQHALPPEPPGNHQSSEADHSQTTKQSGLTDDTKQQPSSKVSSTGQ